MISNDDNSGALVRWSGSWPGVGIVIGSVKAGAIKSLFGHDMKSVAVIRLDGTVVFKMPAIVTLIANSITFVDPEVKDDIPF